MSETFDLSIRRFEDLHLHQANRKSPTAISQNPPLSAAIPNRAVILLVSIGLRVFSAEVKTSGTKRPQRLKQNLIATTPEPLRHFFRWQEIPPEAGKSVHVSAAKLLLKTSSSYPPGGVTGVEQG